MKAIVFLSLILVSCGAPHSKAEYDHQINALIKESYDTLTYRVQHGQSTFLIKEKYDSKIDSIRRERDHYYK